MIISFSQRRRPRQIALLLAITSVLLTACGGGGGGSSNNAGSSSPVASSACASQVPPSVQGGGAQLTLLSSNTSCGVIASTASLNLPQAVAEDSFGNVYVADTANDTVREISYTGAVSTLAGSAGLAGSSDGSAASARFNAPAGIAVDGSGDIYVADTGNDSIRKISASGQVSTVAGAAALPGSSDNTVATSGRLNSPVGLSVDGSGNLYIADTGNHLIRELSSAGALRTLAGTAAVAGHADGAGLAASFNSPASLVFNQVDQNIYVADTGNDSIRELSSSSGSWTVSTIAGTVGSPGSTDASTGLAAQFRAPAGITADAAGNLEIADTGNNTLRRLTPAGPWGSSTLVGVAGQAGAQDTLVTGDNSGTTFNRPSGLVIDANYTIYVADAGNDLVRRVLNSNTIVLAYAGQASVAGNSNGMAAIPSLQAVAPSSGLVADAAGNIYLGDLYNAFIREISPTGLNSVVAGTPGVMGGNNGNGGLAQFDYPLALAMDSSGNIYVADGSNREIRKISSSGVVSVLAGSPSLSTLTDGTGSAAGFNDLHAITVDPSGNVYVTDTDTVREISPTGVVTTIAGEGNPDTPGSSNGVGSAALFACPEGIASDSSGNLYVADSCNNTLRKLVSSSSGGNTVWTVSTLAGTAGNSGSNNASNGPAASFNDPFQLTISGSSGNIYVADRGNALIRKVTPLGAVSTVIGVAGSSAVSTGSLSGATLSSPSGVVVLPNGQMAVLDSDGNGAYVLVTTGASF